MVHFSDDTHSLADFTREMREHLDRLKATGRPEVLTVDGKAEVIVQDVDAYQKLLDALDEAQAVAGIRRGLESMNRGQGRPAREVLKEIEQRHKISRTP